MTAPRAFPDIVQPFQIEGANIRGRVVRLGDSYRRLLETRPHPPRVAQLLGETAALTTALATSLKFDGKFILQTQSDGPVSMMVTEITSDGDLRAYARFDEQAVARLGDGDTSLPALMGSGQLAFTVIQGSESERYQGIVALEGATLAECAQSYFRQSEQLETAIMLAAAPATGDTPPRAAGLMIQRLPGEQWLSLLKDQEDDAWRTSVILMGSLKPAELLDPSKSCNGILYSLYHENGVRVFDPREVRYRCHCSSEKISDTLALFSEEDLIDMRDDRGRIVATCEFCQTEYIVRGEDVTTS